MSGKTLKISSWHPSCRPANEGIVGEGKAVSCHIFLVIVEILSGKINASHRNFLVRENFKLIFFLDRFLHEVSNREAA